MFPIGDSDVKEAGPGLVTIALLAVNTAVFLAQVTVLRPQLQQIIHQYGAVPTRILEGEQLYSIVTSMFLHGGWVHLISNMLFLGVFGDNVEAALGRGRFVLFYFAGGVAAMAAHILINPGSNVPSVGASGAIGAVLGAYVVMFPTSQVRVLLFLGFFFIIRRITAIVFIGVWFALQFLSGLAALGVETAEAGGVAVWAHIGGFALGLLAGFIFKGQAKELTLERESPPRDGGIL